MPLGKVRVVTLLVIWVRGLLPLALVLEVAILVMHINIMVLGIPRIV